MDDANPPSLPMSLGGRMVNILAVPSEVLGEVKRSGPCAANWLVPGALISLVGILASLLVFAQPAVQQQMREMTLQSIERQIQLGKVPPAQAEKMREMAESYGSIGFKISAFGAPLFTGFAVPVIWGLMLWLVARLVYKAEFDLMKVVEMTGLAGMVSLLDTVVRSLLILTTGNLFASAGPVLLIKNFDAQNPTHTLVAVFNVLVFWVLGVRAVGLSHLAGISFFKASVWVFGIWATYTGVMVGFGYAMKAVFN
ncbi:MAG TPA: hypothetical protein VN673_09715 [Clostridia bacterium]|nr:hypothetical protein [Clostridia bacterium]